MTSSIVLAVLVGCSGSQGSDALASWTRSLAATQIDGPELTIFRHRSDLLIFVGVEHDADPSGPTHQLIGSAFALAAPEVVIVEGIPTDWGIDSPKLISLAEEALDAHGLQPNGETVPAVRGALRHGSRLLGGEPSDRQVRETVNRLGYNDRDLLGFYVLRVVPQWIIQDEIADLADPRAINLINEELARSSATLGLSQNILPNAASWYAWRRQRNPAAHSARLAIEEAGPLADGPWPSSRIGAAISRVRDVHLYNLTVQQLSEHQTVMVVYGGSHALIQRPALTKLLGQPCYQGVNIEQARESCNL